jgi:hypothetical protein
VIDHYDRGIIAGQRSSVPYIRRKLEEVGKEYCYVPSYAPEIIEKLDGDWDAILACGPQGRYDVKLPTFAIMRTGRDWVTLNVEGEDLAADTFSLLPQDIPKPKSDWYYPLPMSRSGETKIFKSVRAAVSRRAKQVKTHQRRQLSKSSSPAS